MQLLPRPRPQYACLLISIALGFVAACPNPHPHSGLVAHDGAGIRDYYTVRATDDGRITSRDISPEPRPREAITGDDYFQLKLEHIFLAEELSRDVGNLAIIVQLEGLVPETMHCQELDVRDLDLDLDQRERGFSASRSCAYKHVVSINPVFQNAHATFDSAFITPPFRMGNRPIGLRFIIAQLNDYELARRLLNWSEGQLAQLDELGLTELNEWQSGLVNVGYTVANYLLDYASEPTYIFEYETDFVPIEIVGGVTTPQNLFMGGDFVIVGFPRLAEGPAGAQAAADQLAFDSGRLYWRDSQVEYREGPYIVFKVVRQSRFPAELPTSLARVAREIERGNAPDEVVAAMRIMLLDLQDERVLNETEGRFLLDTFEWYEGAAELEVELEGATDGERAEPAQWPLQMRDVPPTIGFDLSLLPALSQVGAQLERLDERIYENYGRNPGIWQAECVQLRSMTQRLADGYADLRPLAEIAFEDLQMARRAAQRSGNDSDEIETLSAVEVWAQRTVDQLPTSITEPQCPGLRR